MGFAPSAHGTPLGMGLGASAVIVSDHGNANFRVRGGNRAPVWERAGALAYVAWLRELGPLVPHSYLRPVGGQWPSTTRELRPSGRRGHNPALFISGSLTHRAGDPLGAYSFPNAPFGTKL